MKLYKKIRAALFVLLGLLTFLFNKAIEEKINYVIGAVMILYGIDILLEDILESKLSLHHTRLSEYLVLFILGIITIILGKDNLDLTCIIWAIWSIDRETIEISHKVLHNTDHLVSCIVNGIESIVVIILSALLITNPHHHCHLHVLLLGIELILEVTWPYINILEDKINALKVNK